MTAPGARLVAVDFALIERALNQIGYAVDEGWCPLCKAKVGNGLPCNDHRHKDWCVIHDLRAIV
ncbi:hypothetical protein FDH02_gp39 [Pseudomonas phage VSW-3]|uniref:Uncharacterized protein n=1 Tax=Pseudomonas phage VSW-3 TaxID=1852562 RepID=A0A173GD16_9CAUD|nr:hypothetical protein FDH02_gp39 [Pseudomonas phage VSW-3]ANH51115.1 hypothetical protein VSW3_39 [Pseudomonas phage VSW-3]